MDFYGYHIGHIYRTSVPSIGPLFCAAFQQIVDVRLDEVGVCAGRGLRDWREKDVKKMNAERLNKGDSTKKSKQYHQCKLASKQCY